eukprot:14243848-Alexandrium_andersonii.AAC.1
MVSNDIGRSVGLHTSCWVVVVRARAHVIACPGVWCPALRGAMHRACTFERCDAWRATRCVLASYMRNGVAQPATCLACGALARAARCMAWCVWLPCKGLAFGVLCFAVCLEGWVCASGRWQAVGSWWA